MALAFTDVADVYEKMEMANGRVYVVPKDSVGPGAVEDESVKKTLYSRCTTFIDCLTSEYGLNLWEQRKLVVGLAMRPTLLLGVTAHSDDVKTLNEVMTTAKELAGSKEKADAGTFLHAIIDRLDRGEKITDLVVPEDWLPDVEAHLNACEGIRWLNIEDRVVLDPLKITGTPDRIGQFKARHPRWEGVRYPDGRKVAGTTAIFDKKVGKVDDKRILKMAMQLAVYSRAWLYDPDSGERTAHGADTKWGVIVHTPLGTGRCELIWVDLAKGWEYVQLAHKVRQSRNLKMKDLSHSLSAGSEVDPVPDLLRGASTVRELEGVYRTYEADWTEEHTKLAARRKADMLSLRPSEMRKGDF